MSKDDKIQIDGTIIASLPGGFFQVQLPEEFGGGWMVIRWQIGWKLRKHYIRLMVGDKVTVELSPYDLNRGIIVFRHNTNRPNNESKAVR